MTTKYEKMMLRLAKIKAVRPLLNIIEGLNHLRILFLVDMMNGNKLEKKAVVYAIKIIWNYFSGRK